MQVTQFRLGEVIVVLSCVLEILAHPFHPLVACWVFPQSSGLESGRVVIDKWLAAEERCWTRVWLGAATRWSCPRRGINRLPMSRVPPGVNGLSYAMGVTASLYAWYESLGGCEVGGLGPCSLLFTASPVVGSAGLSSGNDLSVVWKFRCDNRLDLVMCLQNTVPQMVRIPSLSSCLWLPSCT